MLDGSNDVDLQKGVPFVGFVKSPPQKKLKLGWQNIESFISKLLH